MYNIPERLAPFSTIPIIAPYSLPIDPTSDLPGDGARKSGLLLRSKNSSNSIGHCHDFLKPFRSRL